MRIWLLAVAVVVGGCSLFGDDDDARIDTAIYRAGLGRDLDVLFVIDNSSSMGEEQVALASHFPRLVNALATLDGGLPDLHVGVVSTDVGSGDQEVSGCTMPAGDDGNLLTSGCDGLTAAFLSDVAAPDGGRVRNYTGDLAARFSCLAQLGTTGCGFEQPLEAMRRAVQPGRNLGFLRPAARLAVIFLGDEDDCSAVPGGALFADPAATISSPLGPRTSFRCHEFGVACADDPDPRALGGRAGCVPRDDSPLVQPVAGYVDVLRRLKPHPTDVVVAGIIGAVDDARTAVVVGDEAGRPMLEASCSSSMGRAFPGFRLRSFLEGFPDRHARASICDDDLSDAIAGIAEALLATLGVPCFELDLADRDAAVPGVQPACTATQFREVDGVRSQQLTIPACDAGAPPCWHLEADATACPRTPDNLRFVVDREGAAPTDATFVEVSCIVNR